MKGVDYKGVIGKGEHTHTHLASPLSLSRLSGVYTHIPHYVCILYRQKHFVHSITSFLIKLCVCIIEERTRKEEEEKN